MTGGTMAMGVRQTSGRAALVCLAGLALLSGCGTVASGTAEESPAASTDESAAVEEEVQQALDLCMTEAGFSVQPPARDGGEWIAAFKECATRLGVLDQVYQAPDEAHQATELERQNREALALVACLRAQGWPAPDPKPDPDGFLLIPHEFEDHLAGLDQSQQAAFQASARQCTARAAHAELPED